MTDRPDDWPPPPAAPSLPPLAPLPPPPPPPPAVNVWPPPSTWQNQRPGRPLVHVRGAQQSEWGPWWLETLEWASLAAAALLLVTSFGDSYIGDCGPQTGYGREVGAFIWFPIILLFAGAFDILIAFAIRPPRSVARFVAVGLIVSTSSVISFLEIITKAQDCR
jgi:hypothetical protein